MSEVAITKKAAGWRFVVLDRDPRWKERLGTEQSVVCRTQASLTEAVQHARSDSTWISRRSERTDELGLRVGRVRGEPLGRVAHVPQPRVVGISQRSEIIPLLRGSFDRVVGDVPRFKLLPLQQLTAVLAESEANRRDLLIGGLVDEETETLALTRGDFETVLAPLSFFRPSGKSAPNFRALTLDDFGQTVRFGSYEATADVILYEFDPDYRQRINARRRREEKGFGPALRRLRKQRGLSQSDFPGLSAKTIARLERGEVDKPHGATLTAIAKRLGVGSNEIETY